MAATAGAAPVRTLSVDAEQALRLTSVVADEPCRLPDAGRTPSHHFTTGHRSPFRPPSASFLQEKVRQKAF